MRELGDRELCEVVAGSTPSTSNPELWDGDILWITPKDLSGFKGVEINDTAKKITRAGYESCSTHLLPAGAVLLSTRAPIGYLAIAGKPLCTNQGFKSFVCKEELNNRYLFYYLKSIVPQLQAEGSGTTFSELSKQRVSEIEIPLSPLETQRKIVSKLDAFFAEYNAAKKQHELAKKRSEKIMQAAISKLITNAAGTWPETKLGSLISLNYGKGLTSVARSGGRVPVYGSNGIVGQHNSALVNQDTIIVGRKGTVGALHYAPFESWPIDTTYYVSVTQGIHLDLRFLYYALKQYDLLGMDTSSAVPGLNRNDVYALDFKLPPLTEQMRIVSELDAIASQISSLTDRQSRVGRAIGILPSAILRKAFSGELVAE